MKPIRKLILFHPSLRKHGGAISSRIWLLFLLSLISLSSIFSLLAITTSSPSPNTATTSPASPLPQTILTALLYYATNPNSTSFPRRFSPSALKSVAAILHSRGPCNFLIFGLTHETILWKTLNLNGRTVFIDESPSLVSEIEERNPEVEAYDIQFTSKSINFQKLINYAKSHSRNICRPVQNLLYSTCKLGINDLPNFVYDMAWDVILVDGPAAAAGRAAAIFTAGVLARSKRCGVDGGTHVFVHEFDREVDGVCSGEFLCGENLLEKRDGLSHFVLGKMVEGSFGFCSGKQFEENSLH